MTTIYIRNKKDLQRLRRLSLAAQGLIQSKPFGHGLDAARKAIQHLGYIQIDTISVVERAHHHVFFSRIPNYQPTMLHSLMAKKDIFEYWAHAAAFLPREDFRFSLPYKRALKNGQIHWYKNPDRKLMTELLSRIRSDGPLRARDLESDVKRKPGWWNLKPAKKALEQLYMEGDLMVSNRDGFQKTYDLRERVLPKTTDVSMPSEDEFAQYLIQQQLRCNGIASLKGFTYLRRDASLRKKVKNIIDAGLADDLYDRIVFGNGEEYISYAGLLDQPMPKLGNRVCILSPFDNAVIQRERLKVLFDFDYQIECYVPESKRKYGYFSLPLLYKGEFIGRMDCKAHRKDRHLEIKYLHIENHILKNENVVSALASSIYTFSAFQSCDSITVTRSHPRTWAKPILSLLDQGI